MTATTSDRILGGFCLAACLLAVPSIAAAAGGTSIVATPGQPAYVNPAWPEGVAELVNDPARTDGWNSWFTEWPNDVNQYAYQIENAADLNRLIKKLADVKSELRQIRLSYLTEPRGLGWVTALPEDNGIPVIFSVGDQSRIDQWYGRVRKPFGKMEFVAAPVAVPPTLTLFVQNNAIDLDELEIPTQIEVTSGYVPVVFHKSNTTREKKQAEAAARKPKGAVAEQPADELEDAEQKAVEQIQAYLATRANEDPKKNQD